MTVMDEVKRRIEQALPGSRVEIGTFGGGGDHLSAVVEAPQFRDKSRLEQHRMVYAAVDGLFDGPVHALALKTRVLESVDTAD